MKECPICHTQYDDSINFCTKDGCQLIVAESSNTHTMTSLPKPKKGVGCLKMIIIAVVVIVIALIACYNYLMNAATYLRAEPNCINAGKAGVECKVKIDYDGYVWIINHKPDWVEIDENDDSFMLEITPNRTGYEREGSITIQSGDCLEQVLIHQKAQTSYIRPSKTSVHFPESGGRTVINIETDGCKCNVSDSKYFRVFAMNEKISIEAYDNSDEVYRSEYITISEDNIKTRIYITQTGFCPSCNGRGTSSCFQCAGQGGWGFGMYYSQCWACGGTGRVQCSSCNGTGLCE